MSNENISVLELFYKRLYSELKKAKRLKQDSVLISLMETKSNDRFDFLIKAGVDTNSKYGDDIFLDYVEKGYLIITKDNKKYILSGKGIWHIERDKIGIETLIDYLDSKLFGGYRKKAKLAPREKVIILSFVAIGAFSKNQVIDLKTDDITKDKIKEILNSSLNFLKNHKLIKKSFTEENLYGKIGNEHPVSNVIRHTDALPKKTIGCYVALGDQKYYLNLYDGEKFDCDKMAYLYWLLFEDHGLDLFTQFLKFVEEIYDNYSIYVFKETPSLSIFEIKDFLEDAFHKYSFKIDVWSKLNK